MEVRPGLPESSRSQLRRLYRYMSERYFVAGREELMVAGFAPARIDNWIRTGRLIVAMRGVYAFGRDVDSTEAVWRAALLGAGPTAALTGRSACQKWGFVAPDAGLPGRVEVAVASGNARTLRPCSPALCGIHMPVARRGFVPDSTLVRDRLRLVTPVHALIDFAAAASARDVRFAFLEACRLGRFGPGDVGRCHKYLTGRRGAAKLRPHLNLWVPELSRTRSVLEGWFLLAWVDAGYPLPRVNEKVFGHEVDFYWPGQRRVLEVDGAAYHSDPVRKRIDFEKQQDLESHGLGVDHLTYHEFAAGPDRVVREIARELGFA